MLPAHKMNEIIEPGQTAMSSIELAERFFAQFSCLSDQTDESMCVQSLENFICTVERERFDVCSHLY